MGTTTRAQTPPPQTHFFKKNYFGAGEITQWLPVYCFPRESKFCSQYPCQAASTTCNSSYRGANNPFWPWRALHSQTHTYLQTHKYTQFQISFLRVLKPVVHIRIGNEYEVLSTHKRGLSPYYRMEPHGQNFENSEWRNQTERHALDDDVHELCWAEG